MKKLMMALAVAGLAFAAVSCSDEKKEDEVACPENPIAFQMIADLEGVSSLSTATLDECINYAEKIADVSDKYASQYDAAKAEAESLKDTSTGCKVKLGLLGVLHGLTVPDLYTKISEQGEACKVLLVGDENAANLEKMNGALTTTEGWRNILLTAANAL